VIVTITPGNYFFGEPYNATVTINDDDEHPPVIDSPATASPNPALVGASVEFSVTASDPDDDALTYTWNFSDGSSGDGSAPTHVYRAANVYSATVTVSDGKGGSATSSVSVTVNTNGGGGGGGGGDGGSGGTPPGMDSDGDSVSDENEIADGTNPLDPLSFLKTPMTVAKLSGKVNFKSSGKDGCSVAGVVPSLPALFDPAGVAAKLDVGGARVLFTLDAKGRSRAASGALSLILKPTKRNKSTRKTEFLGGPVAFKANVKNSSLHDYWTDEGLQNQTASGTLNLVIDLYLNGRICTATVPASYSGKADAGAKLKK
jgi:hypothetical protein